MTLLIYGAYGYTGELVAREAVDRNLDVELAGRNGTKTRGLAIQLGVDSRVFPVEEAAANLDGIDAVLNCAGPFAHTAESMVAACLATGTDYLDITGELPVFEALAEQDRDAEQADICLLPGVGFDVVPTDCLAAHLHDRFPGATHLRLGFEPPGTVSGGTLATFFEHLGGGSTVRQDGRLVEVPLASDPRTIDFGAGPRTAVRMPWGDVSTAYYTTGVRNVEVYMPVPERTQSAMRLLNVFGPLVDTAPVKRTLQWAARTLVDGPDADERESARTFVWGEASNGDRTATSRLVTPEPYTLTADAAVSAAENLADSTLTGYHTPASAFDAEFVLGLEGVEGFLDEDVPSLL